MRSKELVRLVAGFKRFRQKYFDGENSVYRRLSQSGQSPKTLIIACSDSRVDPAIISSASPGEIFVVRNVANLVPPYEELEGFHGISSAIEFAVVGLRVENIVVLGHRQCGGIRALMNGPGPQKSVFLDNWVSIAADAKKKVLVKYKDADPEAQIAHCEREAVLVSLQNLRTFPFIAKAIEEGRMNLIGAYFDLEEGHLLEVNEETGEFTSLED
jgi:carbonic anhydrase